MATKNTKKVSKADETVVEKKVAVPKAEKTQETKAKTTAPKKTAAKPEKKQEVKAKTVSVDENTSVEKLKNEVVKEGIKSVMIATSEAVPFAKTGGLADVASALAKALKAEGVDARVIMPLYFNVSNNLRQTMQFMGKCNVTLAWRYQYCGIFHCNYDSVDYYFVDNEYYFKRNGLYGHFDDAERFAFFSKAVLEALRIINFYPQIIHCNDWHTALTPVFLDAFYRGVDEYKFIRTIFTIHNIEFQGKYGTGIIGDILGLPYDLYKWVEYQDCANFMKGGIECANMVTTVSETYANEILDSYYGFGLEDILRARKFKLCGIINGIDTASNDPSTDKALFKNYDVNTYSDKINNKIGLQEMLGLPVNAEVPMIGMVTRLTEQKGMDLIAKVIDSILEKNLQLVILGTGDWRYENLLKEMQAKYSGKFRAIISFSSDMASKIYAASDMFLMPSKFEPCGLSQMIAMRYGSVPIVRLTGGLKDTVVPYDHTTGIGNGFTFYSYNSGDMLYAIERAVGLYYDYKGEWMKMVKNGMNCDFSWKNISKRYISLYNSVI